MAWCIYPVPPPGTRWRTAWDTWRAGTKAGLRMGPEPGPGFNRRRWGKGERRERVEHWTPPVVKDPKTWEAR